MEIKSFDGTSLRGTLALPSGKRPGGIVIPVHGSFLQTRDGDLDGGQRWMFPEGVPKRQLFLDMSNQLVDFGWGAFRYDKRASGESGGDYRETDILTLARDLGEVFAEIRRRFPDTPIGFAGQSEGALTVLTAWKQGIKPDFLILQGPALEPFDITLEFQRTHGAAPFLREELKGPLSGKYPYLAAFYHAMFYGDMLDEIRNGNAKYYELDWNGFTYRTNLQKYREYMTNGLEVLKTIDVPVLVVMGSEDGNVRAEAARYISERQGKGEYNNVTVRIIEGLEHSFRAVDPEDTFIDAMAKPLSPKYVDVLQEFCLRSLPNSCAGVFSRINRKEAKMGGGTP